MSNETNIEARVDELSKPENKTELNDRLNEAFKVGTQTNQPAPAPAEDKPEDKGDKADENKENNGQKTDDPSQNAGDKAEDRKTKVEKLLSEKNEAEVVAANNQTEVQILTKRVEDLTKLLEKSAGQGTDAAANNGADENNDNKSTSEIVKQEIAKIEEDKQKLIDAEKSLNDQIQALDTNNETPNAKEYAAEIKQVMQKFKGMSAIGAYGFLKGNGIIPSDATITSNANRTGTGNRSKTTLLDNKKPQDLSQAEAFEMLKAEEKSGGLKGLI